MKGRFVFVGLCLSALTYAQQVKVYFDGEVEDMREPPILRGGRTLLGLREVFDRLGCVVYYDSRTKTITAWRAERTINLQIGRAEAMIDGRTVTLDQPPIIEGRTTYVPLRFISESLGAGCKYVGSENSVYIDSKAMRYFSESAPFKAGDKALYLYRREWHHCTILKVYDNADQEDSYQIDFTEPSGRKITPTVLRRYVRFPSR